MEGESQQPKILLSEGILVTLLIGITDLIEVFLPFDFFIVDAVRSVIFWYLKSKGIWPPPWMAIGAIADVVPLASNLPCSTAGWLITWFATNHPRITAVATKIAVTTGAAAATAATGGAGAVAGAGARAGAGAAEAGARTAASEAMANQAQKGTGTASQRKPSESRARDAGDASRAAFGTEGPQEQTLSEMLQETQTPQEETRRRLFPEALEDIPKADPMIIVHDQNNAVNLGAYRKVQGGQPSPPRQNNVLDLQTQREPQKGQQELPEQGEPRKRAV